MVYTIFTSFIYLFVLYTKKLTDGQVVAITMIMVAARIFDAFNDPIMGNIIERTRTKWGKFKPWQLAGSISSSIVLFLAFNTKLTGWSFVIFFGIIYFLYSITYTMNDISYWGMIPAVSRTSDSRNQFTARTTLFAGIGSTLAGLLIPMFTAGKLQLGGNSSSAYGIIALVVVITSLCYLLFRVTDFTNQIAGFEQAVNQNLITTEMKNAQIANVIQNIGQGQSVGMLLFMVIVPFVLLLASYFLYIRFYKLDEDTYAQILSELEK